LQLSLIDIIAIILSFVMLFCLFLLELLHDELGYALLMFVLELGLLFLLGEDLVAGSLVSQLFFFMLLSLLILQSGFIRFYLLLF